MNIKRYLNGKLYIHYNKWNRWRNINVSEFWSGRLIYLTVGKICIVLDCRIDVMEDLITGNAK